MEFINDDIKEIENRSVVELIKVNLVPSTVNSIVTIDKKGIVTGVRIDEKEFTSVVTSLIETFSGTRNYTLALVTSKTNIKSITLNVIDSLLGSINSSIFVVLSDNMHPSLKLDSSVVTYLTNLTKSYDNEFV
jgi:hypothetical protein